MNYQTPVIVVLDSPLRAIRNAGGSKLGMVHDGKPLYPYYVTVPPAYEADE